METDKEFLRIFKPNPELFGEFLGIKTEGACTLRSETLKALERRIDGVLEFNSWDPLTLVEIQGYRDLAVYQRMISAMAHFQLDNPNRLVHGIIVFLKKEYDPCSYPWKSVADSSLPALKVLYLEKILASLAERDPNHVLLSVFAPLTCPDITELRRTATGHYRRLKHARINPEKKEGLLDAFESWLFARFKDRAEVQQMIVDIPPIEKSAAAKYFQELGEKRGLKLGEKRGLKLGEKRGIKLGEKRGEERGEIKAIRSQIARLKKLELDMAPQLFKNLLSPLEQRLNQLLADK